MANALFLICFIIGFGVIIGFLLYAENQSEKEEAVIKKNQEEVSGSSYTATTGGKVYISRKGVTISKN